MLEFSIAVIIFSFDSPPLMKHRGVGFPSRYIVFDMVCPGAMTYCSNIILSSSFNLSLESSNLNCCSAGKPNIPSSISGNS